ncbi:MAG: protein phosphatase 2C domain-containing protein [Patescibacteria group bacterium]|nr:protein phosphatase 2C domain-containing protein [Patescibacteria group bacterium]
MVLEISGRREDTLWKADTRKEKIEFPFGNKRLGAGEIERRSESSDDVLVEVVRRANPERKDGLVGDNYCVLPKLDVYAVFDGVSMSDSDARSSFLSAKLLEHLWEKKLKQKNKKIDDFSLQEMHDLMLDIVHGLQSGLSMGSKKNSEDYFSTFSMVKIHEGHCLVVSVGDSPVFLQTSKGLEQVTIAHDEIRKGAKDSSGRYLPQSIDELNNQDLNFDRVALQTSQRNPGIIRNNPTSLIGSKGDISVDFYIRELNADDVVLLATDGAAKHLDNLRLNNEDSAQTLADGMLPVFDRQDDATAIVLQY